MCLMGGANSAWGDDVVFTQVASYDFEGDTPSNPFTDHSGISGRCNSSTYTDETISSTALKFSGSNLSGKTYGYHVLDFSTLTGSSSAVKIAFDFKMANQNHTHFTIRDASIATETNKSSYQGTGSIFRFGNSRVSSANRYGYNGNAVTGASYDTWYHIEVIVDIVNKKVSYTLKSFDQKTEIDSKTNLAFLNSSATACTQLDFFGISNAEMASIDNIVVSEYTSSSATTYSVEKYDKLGNLLSTTSGLSGVSGETSSVSAADKNNFYSLDSNTKYVFDSTDERNVTSLELTSNEATNVLKLYFNSYAKYTATVSSMCGENSIADITGSWYADETPVTLYWPKVVSCPDGYYIIDAEESTPYYGYTFSLSDLTKTVTYTLDEDIIYYSEYENILSNKNTYEYFSAQSSKGASRCIQKTGIMKTAMGLVSTGVYDVIFACGNRDGSHTATLDMKLIDSEDNISTENILYATFTSNEWKGELTANKVTIPAGSELYFANDNGEGNARIAGDYIIVRKSYANASISAVNYGTYSSDYALDFEHATGVCAYYASAATDGKVTMTKVTGTAAAGEGLFIEKVEGDISIPVVTSGTELTGNKLKAGGVEAPADSYVFANQGGVLGFYKLSTATAIPSGKAYLEAGSYGSRMVIAFEDETTGISELKQVDQMNLNEAVYNLRGQRVAQPVKGLYIINGKKILMK